MVIKIGTYEVKDPKAECSDINCPFHGTLKVRGRTFIGTVKSDKMSKTVTVIWDRTIRLVKYNRYMVKRSKVKAHNPECINAKAGDTVLIAECRPLSKTKTFVVLKITKKSKAVKLSEGQRSETT